VKMLKAGRFLLGLGLRIDPKRLVVAFVFMLLSYGSMPLAALAIAAFADDLIAHRAQRALVLAPVIALLLVGQAMGHHFSNLCYRRVAEEQNNRLYVELIETVSTPPGIEHFDDPAFSDTLEMVRGSLFVVSQALESMLELSCLLVQIAITIAILVHLDPWLVLLPAFAIPPVLLGDRAQSVLEAWRERCTEQVRLNRHLVEMATSPETVMEMRIFGDAGEMARRQEVVWDEITRNMTRGQAASALRRSLGQLIFTVGYGGAILLVVRQALAGTASVGSLILVITLAIQVKVQISGAIGQLTGLQAAGRTVERIALLRRGSQERAAVTTHRRSQCEAPERIEQSIVLDDVCFSYPGASELAIDHVSLEVPTGSTLALVGENGAGKSTLVKLLCGLYTPVSGRIVVDGVDLADLPSAQWRKRVAALFQDFFRLEFVLRESVGLGEIELMQDSEAVGRALTAAHAQQLVSSVRGGTEGVVGHNYKPGSDLSGGQWQLLALARCLMRQRPLLLVLDEPAAALDAAAEHALFERYASTARVVAQDLGTVTLLVSHRFSTVLMADTIAVLDQGRVVEYGSHAQLMAGQGLYAELFSMQARAYR
jgi:ATP-binding cassette, subfamily B, bacterial